jgi:hypothetical protein
MDVLLDKMALFGISISPDMTAGDVLVGTGTLALAIFTGRLASRTSDEVSLSEKQLRLTQESIEAIDRPFIVVSRRDEEMAQLIGNDDAVKFTLSNLGKGPGIVSQLAFMTPSGDNLLKEPLGEARSLAPRNRVPLILPLGEQRPKEGEMLTMQIAYSSASGYRYCTETDLLLIEQGRFSYQGHRRKDLGILPK